jgi:hypothetical protein
MLLMAKGSGGTTAIAASNCVIALMEVTGLMRDFIAAKVMHDRM